MKEEFDSAKWFIEGMLSITVSSAIVLVWALISLHRHGTTKKGKMKTALKILVLLLFAVGCRAQVPPTGHTVTLTWTVPSPSGAWAGCGSGQPSCAYVVSRAAASGSSCPSTTGSNYTPLNQTTPAVGTSYVDFTATGQTVCYIAQTVQGSAVSQPSAPAGPLTVPGNPLAPSLNTTQAKAKPSTMMDPTTWKLTARVGK